MCSTEKARQNRKRIVEYGINLGINLGISFTPGNMKAVATSSSLGNLIAIIVLTHFIEIQQQESNIIAVSHSSMCIFDFPHFTQYPWQTELSHSERRLSLQNKLQILIGDSIKLHSKTKSLWCII